MPLHLSCALFWLLELLLVSKTLVQLNCCPLVTSWQGSRANWRNTALTVSKHGSQVLSRYRHHCTRACGTPSVTSGQQAPGGANWWWRWSRTRGKAPAGAPEAVLVLRRLMRLWRTWRLSLTSRCLSSGAAGRTTLTCRSYPFQLLEYQMVWWVCRFDTLGKLVSAHRAGVPTTHGWWVTPTWWVRVAAAAPPPPTGWG